MSEAYDGENFFTAGADGVRMATPLLLALAVVEISDVVFAVDSIPAVSCPYRCSPACSFMYVLPLPIFFSPGGAVHAHSAQCLPGHVALCGYKPIGCIPAFPDEGMMLERLACLSAAVFACDTVHRLNCGMRFYRWRYAKLLWQIHICIGNVRRCLA